MSVQTEIEGFPLKGVESIEEWMMFGLDFGIPLNGQVLLYWLCCQFDEVRDILILCSQHRGEIPFDELHLDSGSLPDLEDGTPDCPSLFDETFDGIGPELVRYADCALLI